MAKKVNTAAIAIGVVGLVAVVYLVTRKKSSTYNPGTTYIPDSSVQQSQLLAWANEQNNSLSLSNMIKNLSITDLLNLWNSVFGNGEADSSDTDSSDIYDYFNSADDSWLWV